MKPYKTPTQDMAAAREMRKVRLRRKYNIKEGQVIPMHLKVGMDETSKEKIIKVKVMELYKDFIVIRRPAGYNETFSWAEFEKRRRD